MGYYYGVDCEYGLELKITDDNEVKAMFLFLHGFWNQPDWE